MIEKMRNYREVSEKKTPRKRQGFGKQSINGQEKANQNKAPQTVEVRGCADNPVQSGLSIAANDGQIINHFNKKAINIKANAQGSLTQPNCDVAVARLQNGGVTARVVPNGGFIVGLPQMFDLKTLREVASEQ